MKPTMRGRGVGGDEINLGRINPQQKGDAPDHSGR